MKEIDSLALFRLQRGYAKAYIACMYGVTPDLLTQLHQTLLQLASGRGCSQQLTDDQQAQPRPSVPAARIVFGGHGFYDFRNNGQ